MAGVSARFWSWGPRPGKMAGMNGTGADMAVTNGTGAVTDGMMSGIGGWRPYLALVPLMLISNLVNIFSAWEDRSWPAWLPVLTEFTSAVSILCLCWLPALALARAPLVRPWGRVALVHAGTAILFSLLHTLGMALLRNGASLLLDLDYRFGVSVPVLIYEGRKDMVTYLVICGVFLLFGHGRPAPRPADAAAPDDAAGDAASSVVAGAFDIRDGARLRRVALADILAVRSAGNYVEFLLAGGELSLMRTTLTRLTEELGAHGFLRVHRSWLINPAHVRALAPEGSGDYALTLSDGQPVPLSRRYPDALAALRGA